MDIAKERNIRPSKAQSINNTALRNLSKNKLLRERYRADVVEVYAYRSSFNAWKYSGYSSVEKTVARLLEMQKRDYNLML